MLLSDAWGNEGAQQADGEVTDIVSKNRKPRIHVDSILICSASRDSEGTLGGVVRMGNTGLLKQIVDQALSEAA
jgi:hypothetical protein